MDGPREVDLIPRPGVKTITSTKYTAVADARKAPARQPVAVCEGLRHFKCVLKTNCAPLRDGAGDSSVQKHVDEKLSKGCDPVLLEVCKLAMLQRQHYLHTGATLQSEVLGLSWGLLALLSKSNGMVSGTDIANLLLHKQLDSSEPEVCRTFDSFEKGTTNLTSLLIAGKTKEAVDEARRQGMWHHALIIRDLERHGPSDCILSRFIKNLDDVDLMKTYYQVRLGEMPAACSQCAMDGCGNWRLHLAIVVGISDSSQLRKEFVAKMAETLASKGHSYAAHFCQMVLQLDLDLLPKASLRSLVGEWMGLLAEMQKEITQTPLVASAQRPMGKKVPLSENHFKSLIGPLLPPAVPKADEALVEIAVDQSPPVDAGKHPMDHENRKALLSENFRELIGPLLPPAPSVPKDDEALVEEQGNMCLTKLEVKPLKKAANKKQSKMSWLLCFSCFGSRTMD